MGYNEAVERNYMVKKMKRNVKFLIVLLASIMMAPVVNAQNASCELVTSEERCITFTELGTKEISGTLKLNKDITLSETIELTATKNKNLTIDLNNHSITWSPSNSGNALFYLQGEESTLKLTGNGSIKANNSNITTLIRVSDDSNNAGSTLTVDENVTLDGSKYPILVSDLKSGNNKVKANIEVSGTIVNAVSAGVYVNGELKNSSDDKYPTININETAYIGPSEDGENGVRPAAGIYQAGYSDITVKGTIIGGSGIVTKAGKLNVNGATITAEGDKAEPSSQVGGFSVTGDAIQIESNNSYAGQVELTVNDATVTSENGYGIQEYGDNGKVSKAEVTDSTFESKEGTIKATNTNEFKNSIKSGTFTKDGEKDEELVSSEMIDTSVTLNENGETVNKVFATFKVESGAEKIKIGEAEFNNNDTNNNFTANQQVTLTVLSYNAGYEFGTVTVTYTDGTEASKSIDVTVEAESNTATFTIPSDAKTITVNVNGKKIDYQLTTESEHGKVFVTKVASENEGQAITTANINDKVYVHVTPEEGYLVERVLAVTVDAQGTTHTTQMSSSNATYTYSSVISDVTFKVIYKLKEYTITKDEDITGGTIDVPANGTYTKDVIVSFDPIEGKILDTLTVTDTDGNKIDVKVENVYDESGKLIPDQRKFTMPNKNIKVSATFKEGEAEKVDKYQIEVAEVENGTIATSPVENASEGATVTVIAKANEGYKLSKIVVTGPEGKEITVSSDNTFEMPAGKVTVSAEFVKVYTVEAEAVEGGNINIDKLEAVEGETVTLSYQSAENYEYVEGSLTVTDENGEEVTLTKGEDGKYTFAMPASNVTVTAKFKKVKEDGPVVEKYQIGGVGAFENGNIKSDLREAAAGEEVTIYVTADNGYAVESVTITDANGNNVKVTKGAGSSYSFTMPASNVTIKAVAKIATEDNDVYTFTDNEVTFESRDPFDDSYELRVTELDMNEDTLNAISIEGYDFLKAYDISMYHNDELVHLENGLYTIKLPVNEIYKAYKVGYIDDEDNVVETFDATYEDGYVTFVTTHLSKYVVYGTNTVVEENTTIDESPKTNDEILNYVIVAIVSIGALGISLKKYLRKN